MATNVARLAWGIALTLFCFAFVPTSTAERYVPIYPYGYYPYDSFGYSNNFGLRQDVNRLNKQLQQQQRKLREQNRQQEEQTRLLRQQQASQQQFTAMQACYYRYQGGLDICENLFDAESREYSACFKKAIELNPGCSAEFARRTADED